MGDPQEPHLGSLEGMESVKPRADVLERQRMLARVTAELTETARRPVKIDRYLVLDRLGAGGMGVVYSAYDPKLDRKVAIKVVHARGRDTKGHAALLEEARSLARLGHPNVVAVHEVGELPAEAATETKSEEAELFIVMELVEGQSLDQWLSAEARDAAATLEVFVQAARGLAAAHEQDLVHRDFKPGNVLVGDDGRVRVVDFGLAVDRGAAVSEGAGTPPYMAPEQHEFAELDARSDQYAFCVALYEALAGVRPFPQKTIGALVEAKRTGPSAEALARLPARVAKVIARGLQPEPDHRFASMTEVAEALSPPSAVGRGPLVGAAIVLATGAALAISVAVGGVQDACAEAAAPVQEVWNEGTADTIRGAFANTGLGFHEQVSQRVVGRLDAWAAQWGKESRDACEARRTRGEHSPEFYDLQVSCLDARLGELDALVGVLTAADEEIVRHALTAADALGRLESCSDDEYLRRRVEPPRPENAAAIASVRARLVEAGALRAAGKLDAARHVLESVETDVADIDYPPVHAETALARGIIEDLLGQHEQAEESLRRAWTLAVSVHDDDHAVEAATHLVSAVGWGQADMEQGLVWGENARALMTRAHIGGEARARLLVAEGGVLRLGGRFEDALARQQEALAVTVSEADDEGLFAAHVHNGIATVLVNLGRYEEAMEAFEHALEIRTRLLADNHPAVATSLDNMGVATFERGDVEAAVSYYERALAIREQAFGPDHRETGASLNNLGDAYRALGRYTEARRRHERAHRIFVEALGPDHPNVGVALANLGNVLWYEEEFDAALEHYERALAIFERSFGPEHVNVATLLDSVSRVLVKQEKYDDALAHRRRALAIMEGALGPRHPQTIGVRLAVGDLLLEMNRSEAAEVELSAALAASEHSEIEPLRTAELHFALARAKAKRGRRDEAHRLAARARGIYLAHPDPAHDHVGALDTWAREAGLELP